ncbi:tetratricopeptide repeat protein [Streptomyces sp. enrichment culture]|uniref:tetratricopeptide repeat protein n=1 Tax=Streptomyces sp. enrichment culture TaxID=1795815 RepID=UPI003F567310
MWRRNRKKAGHDHGPNKVNIQGNSHLSANGPHSSVHVTYVGQEPPVEWPLPVGELPLTASALQPRPELRQALERPPQGAGQRPSAHVLVGEGGTGKTQLAAAHAQAAYADGVDLVLWVSAGDTGQIIAAYGDAARRARVPGAEGEDPKADARAFLNWLAATSRRWLVVLDDVTDPDAVSGWWPNPARGNGQVVATTRLRDEPRLTGQGRAAIHVGPYTSAEATAYLTDRLTHDGKAHLLDDRTEALAAALGHLPLGLGHAAAYMVREETSCGRYLELFRDREARLDAVLPPWADTDKYGRQVTTALLLALEATDRDPQGPHARAALQVAAHLDPAGQPASLWATPRVHAHLGRALYRTIQEHAPHLLRDQAVAVAVTQTQVDQALRLLHRYGLISHDATSSTHTVRIHALTARAVRETVPDERLDEAVATASGALHEAWADVDLVERDLHAVLRANGRELIETAGERLWTAGAHTVLFPLGDSLLDTEMVHDALAFWRTATGEYERRLGSEAHLTGMARFRLAKALRSAGKHHEGLELSLRLANEFNEQYGRQHPEALRAYSELAGWCLAAGQPELAVMMFEQVLTARRAVLDPDDPDIVRSEIDVTLAYGAAGQSERLIERAEPLLARCRDRFGPEHNLTLEAGLCLGNAYLGASRFAEAVPVFRQALADQGHVRGADHPDTLTTRAGLALSLWETGHRQEALEHMRAAVHGVRRVQGEEHPWTEAYGSLLAGWEREAAAEGPAGVRGRLAARFRGTGGQPRTEEGAR